ncbi:hypothetical protein H8E77_40810 [bacterium]|nr:hypothetical protein [bacterium]
MNLSWEKAIAQVPGDIMLYFHRNDVASEFNPEDHRRVGASNPTLAKRIIIDLTTGNCKPKSVYAEGKISQS